MIYSSMSGGCVDVEKITACAGFGQLHKYKQTKRQSKVKEGTQLFATYGVNGALSVVKFSMRVTSPWR